MSAREAPRAVILGCAGPVLDAAERAFFRDADPVGFILFQRNCERPEQIRDLVAALRDTVGRLDAPVLIDQEGGRVQRLKPPHWRAYPAAAALAPLGAEAVRLAARLIADDLAALGITIDCLPVLDLPAPGADAVIGSRAYGSDPALVARLGRAACEGLLDGGIVPVLKHIPGHGRGTVDSHFALPVVAAPLDELARTDFAPFRALADRPWAMTAHIVYAAIDPVNPATLSPALVAQIIRGAIGFDGVLVSDDLSMQALGGSFVERAERALAAGCDLVLHCNGKPAEMTDVVRGTARLTPEAERRLRRGAERAARRAEIDRAALERRFDALVAAA